MTNEKEVCGTCLENLFNNGDVPKGFLFLLMLRGSLDCKSAKVQHILLSLNRHCVDTAPREYKQPTLLLLLHRKSRILCASKVEKFQLAIPLRSHVGYFLLLL